MLRVVGIQAFDLRVFQGFHVRWSVYVRVTVTYHASAISALPFGVFRFHSFGLRNFLVRLMPSRAHGARCWLKSLGFRAKAQAQEV